MLERDEFINAGNIPPLNTPTTMNNINYLPALGNKPWFRTRACICTAWIRQTHLKKLQILSTRKNERRNGRQELCVRHIPLQHKNKRLRVWQKRFRHWINLKSLFKTLEAENFMVPSEMSKRTHWNSFPYKLTIKLPVCINYTTEINSVVCSDPQSLKVTWFKAKGIIALLVITGVLETRRWILHFGQIKQSLDHSHLPSSSFSSCSTLGVQQAHRQDKPGDSTR